MQAHVGEFTIVKMCNVLGVSKSGYYNWLQKQSAPLTEREEREIEITQKVHQSFHESYGTYGSPRIRKDLQEWGYVLSQKKIANLMRELGLCAVIPKQYQRTTNSDHDHFIYPDLVKRDFDVKEPNQVWVADITYIRTMQGWLYLASIMDLYSRKIIGWAIADHMKEALVLEALEKALLIRKPPAGCIHHSDRGVQYCSNAYTNLLKEYQMEISMSKKGDPYDNACIESFHSTIKKECIYRQRFQTKHEAKQVVQAYIIEFYNKKRRHSTLGYVSPNQYERINNPKNTSSRSKSA
ncbi:IS3 family transposase [Solibacillus sp. FSL R7-0668]|uniref:IS3 family transposase n=1 Tax=Solibacillus sp. FSL R7-0668 TaxID=2921688 RepID=UPI0030F7A7B8